MVAIGEKAPNLKLGKWVQGIETNLDKNIYNKWRSIHLFQSWGMESIKNPPKIVLTTSDRNFALEAFEYKFVVDYLLKPIEFNRFKRNAIWDHSRWNFFSL